VAARYDVQGIPTLIFFRGGQPVGQTAGVINKAALRTALERAIGKL
jgi:thioredoxin-like negative regulator of GroEL